MSRRLVGLALALALLGLPGCGQEGAVRVLSTTRLRRAVVEEVFRYHGVIEPRDKVAVKSPFDTSLLEWVEHGTSVLAGQVVARVDATPHERELLVLEAALQQASGELDEAQLDLRTRRLEWDERIRAATMRLRRARVAHEALVRGRDVVQILRKTRDQEIDRVRLARLGRDLEAQRPQVEKGFVSAAELEDLQAEITQLELAIDRRALELQVLHLGPRREQVADRALEVAQAGAEVEKVRERGRSQVRMAEGPVARAKDSIEEIEEQIAERRQEVADCSLVAPAPGAFLQNREAGNMWIQVKLDVGARVWSAFPVGWVATGGTCRVRFWVPEAHLPRLVVGRPLRFRVVADQRRLYPAALAEVSRVASFKTDDPVQVRWVEAVADITLPPEDYGSIQPGLNAVVELVDSSRDEVPALPVEALRGRGVLLADGRRRDLELGRVGMELVEVLGGGLLPGEEVVLPAPPAGVGRVVAVTRGELVETYEDTGTLAADGQQTLYNNESEEWRTKITAMAEEGSEVTTGAVCVELDPGEFRNQIESLQEELAQAEAGLEKADIESAGALAAQTEAVAVTRAKLEWQAAKRRALGAGSASEEKAKAAAKLAELQVDADALGKKLAVTRELAGRGFAGQREVDELEERALRAGAAVEVAALEAELVAQGATESERELARLEEEDTAAVLAHQEAVMLGLVEQRAVRLRTARARLEAKRRDLDRRRRQLEGYTLRAGRAGTVVYLTHAEEGEVSKFETGSFARRGEAVVAVADLSRSRIEGLVSEEVAYRVRPGQEAMFWLPSFPEERFAATVIEKGRLPEEIPDGAGEQGFAVVLRVEQHSARLQPGVRVRFEVVLDRLEDALLVPLTAVRSQDGEDLVTMEDQEVRRVEVAGRDRTHAAVRAGLAEGERVRVP